MPVGSKVRAALMAACTSRAAPLISRFKANCSVMLVEPSDEREVISFTPAMLPSTRSSGVATVAAMVSGLAPGRDALTAMVGISTCGNGAMGSSQKHRAPARPTPSVISVVATGLAMKGAEMFMAAHQHAVRHAASSVAPAWQTPDKSPAW